MTKIEKFEDIEAWQKARELKKAIYASSNDSAFARDFGLREQIRRASVSIMSNIAEGFGRGGNKELIQFLFIAKSSAAEVQAQLYVALDAGYLDKEKFQELYDLSNNTCRLIGGFIRYLKAQVPQPKTRHI
jgi:four helix bundle protein